MENEKKLKQVGVPMVKMRLKKGNPSVFESKVGGIVGYLLKGEKIPTDSKGNQLRLLAQINCKDVDLEEFPKEGILQFWIRNDDMYGRDYDEPTKQDTFRVIYHEQIDESVTKEDILSLVIPEEDNDFVIYPFDAECKIEFKKIENSSNTRRHRITHKIGGYPDFIEIDPRTRKGLDKNEYDYLLFQLESTDFREEEKLGLYIMWSDCGFGNFFINKRKLKAKDFSDVFYHWEST